MSKYTSTLSLDESTRLSDKWSKHNIRMLIQIIVLDTVNKSYLEMKGIMHISAGDISQPKQWNDFVNALKSRVIDGFVFAVNLRDVSQMDLALFNSLVMLYVKLKRRNKKLIYMNCRNASLKNLIEKTSFKHVFTY